MILSSGPTGSGKSTTLYSILKALNTPDINIITVEDPVEFRMPNIRQVQLNRKAGMTFATGLRAILRQDPDVIMVGEIRDSETAKIAVQAAMTGHRVLSTVHTNDAAGAITRFVEMDIEPFLVSSVMLVSIGQRLVRRLCDHCKMPYEPSDAVLRHWGIEKDSSCRFMVGKGCFNCRQTGFSGRIGLYEVLVIDDHIRPMILDRKSSHEITVAAQEAGNFLTLKQAAADKIKQGITTFEEAASAIMT
jgi:type IV pilus assembly protein PilB